MRGGSARCTHSRSLLEPLEPRLLLDGLAEQQAIELFGVSPALFVENQGQWPDESVRYAFQGSGANILFTDAGLAFQVFQAEAAEDAALRAAEFSVSFDGAKDAAPVGLDQSQAVFNYYVGDQANWRSNVPAYETISYPGLYDGIDLYTWGRRDSLKYEFHVAPGADYGQIQVSYDGIEGLWRDADGALHVETVLGELIDDAPYIYQEIAGERLDVAGAFELIDADTYAFAITGAYDPSEELIIDPYLMWSSYLGGAFDDWATGIAVDSADNVLVAGSTLSSGWASGGFDTSQNGSWDGFVAKISPAGEHIWSTYLGGGSNDYGHGIATDSSGNVLVAGHTESAGWVSGGFDTSHNGSYDAFVAKLSPAGGHTWSTYLGGSEGEYAYGIGADSLENVLVAGWTYSSGWVSGGFDTTLGGTRDAFVAKMSASGGHTWSTYLGGSGEDGGNGIAVDSLGNVLVAGDTNSSGWVSGGFDTIFNGVRDGYAAKLSGSGGHTWSTYLGGNLYDDAWGIAVDSVDNVLVSGSTLSAGWASGGFDITHNGDWDAFAAKLSASGGHTWSTYLGGDSLEYARGVAVGTLGDVLVAGITGSSGWVSAGSDTSFNGLRDGFAAKLSASGGHVWSTYLGGGDYEEALGVAADSAGNVLVAGSTGSSGWISGGFDTTHNGFSDGFVAKIYGGRPILGDANCDGVVDGADYTIWADNYLLQPVPAWLEGGWGFANFTDDDAVNGADYTLWADNFGNTFGGGGGSAGASQAAEGAGGEEDDVGGAGRGLSLVGPGEDAPGAAPAAVLPAGSADLPTIADPSAIILPLPADNSTAYRESPMGITRLRTSLPNLQLDDEIDLLAGPDLSALGLAV